MGMSLFKIMKPLYKTEIEEKPYFRKAPAP